ncbi:MAG: glutamate--tRNA ligase [Rickettsiales bacterium]
MMTVITRFAPSPTGFLHIGGARTALFNWLYARHHNGKFLLRIEDTDRSRSTTQATEAIIDGMRWLGLDWDGDIVHQFSLAARHKEVADELLKKGKAFYCYTTQEELLEFREKHPNEKFRSPYRSGNKTPPNGVQPTIRLKAPDTGETIVEDNVQGVVKISNSELDDMILLRSDGTPTYMLAVVVDDNDMGITDIIRGDDHFTNSFRQAQIYNAMGWSVPCFSHIPLIHGADGAKLSKRHGALGVGEYKNMGYLPEALRNYLLRLGWSHGDDEIISTAQAIEWFNLEAIGKSPSRFDFAKLDNLNGHYIRNEDDKKLVEQIIPLIEKSSKSVEEKNNILIPAMAGLKQRAKTLVELAKAAEFYVVDTPVALDEKSIEILSNGGREIIKSLLNELEVVSSWNSEEIKNICKNYAEKTSNKLGNIMSPIRAAIVGKTTSPSMFEAMAILGKEESIKRLREVL